ncbi:MAG TPA: DUF6152 family protein [Vicinamibacterales bacterium]|nr:DUF6152 family protein [Vicinamibacterales bacterium]
MRTRLVLIAALLCSMPASAHHSIAGVYDQSKPVTLDGVVTEFKFVNPHPFLVIAVQRSGQSQAWKVELDNRSELVTAGMSARSFDAGDHLTVTGSPARDGSHQAYAQRIERGDGFTYEQVGSSPRITRR